MGVHWGRNTGVDDTSSGGHVSEPITGCYGHPMADCYTAVTSP